MATDEGRRMQLTGLHHITLISSDLERFDRVLPLHAGSRDRARHAVPLTIPTRATCGSARSTARPAGCCRSWSTRSCPTGVAGAGSTHHFALAVETAKGLRRLARLPDRARSVECSQVFDRGGFKFALRPRPGRPRRRNRDAGAGLHTRPPLKRIRPRASMRAAHSPSVNASARSPRRRAASARRWRSVIEPDGLGLWTSGSRKGTAGSGSGPSDAGS